MSIQGIPQLRRLIIYYCNWGGSSSGVRRYLESVDHSRFIENLRRTHGSNVEVRTDLRKNRHPYMKAVYLNGHEQTISLRNLEPHDIKKSATQLRDQTGRKLMHLHLWPHAQTGRRSLQGKWEENLNIAFLADSVDSETAIKQKEQEDANSHNTSPEANALALFEEYKQQNDKFRELLELRTQKRIYESKKRSLERRKLLDAATGKIPYDA